MPLPIKPGPRRHFNRARGLTLELSRNNVMLHFGRCLHNCDVCKKTLNAGEFGPLG